MHVIRGNNLNKETNTTAMEEPKPQEPQQPVVNPSERSDDFHRDAVQPPKPKPKKKWLWISLAAILVAAGLGYWFFVRDEPQASINSYDECVAAGYPVMESYPEQCAVPDGQTFTRQLSEEEQAALDEAEQKYTPTASGWSTYTDDNIGFSFDYPNKWGTPLNIESTNEYWGVQIYTIGLTMAANAKSVCPQGDGPLISTTQGYYESNGVYYKNWCPEEDSSQEYEVVPGETEPKVLITTNNEEVIYIEEVRPCGNFYCDDEDAKKTLSTLNAMFNLVGETFPGVGISVHRLEDDSPTYKDIKDDLFTMLKSFKATP